jgi:hypothetical protein
MHIFSGNRQENPLWCGKIISEDEKMKGLYQR